MEALGPEVMIRQVEALAEDLRTCIAPIAGEVERSLGPLQLVSIEQIYLIGDGDSYHASCATELSFEAIAGIPCRALSAQRFLNYQTPWLRRTPPLRTLLIATSSSGETQRVLQSIDLARQEGALTVAVTGVSSSTISGLAHQAIAVEVPHKERSPGIRTYQASLLGMLLLAIHLAERRGRLSHTQGDEYRQELAALDDCIDATNGCVRERCRDLAATIGGARAMAMLGSGPSFGTAHYAAAKIIEGSGILAFGQDLEEWWHVERFAHPFDMPVVIIAPPGRAYWRAESLATGARQLGRHVIGVTRQDDDGVSRHAHVTLPVRGEVREEFSPLLYHLFASFLAAYLGEQLGRSVVPGRSPGPTG